MSNYILTKEAKTGEIIYMQYRLSGYNFRPRNISRANISLEKITIIKPSIIDGILTQKVDKKISKIIRLVMYILNDEDGSTDPSDVMLALNEITKLRRILLNRYQDFITKENEELFLKKLRILENELRIKIISYEHDFSSRMGSR